MSQINPQTQVCFVNNQLIPKEGPKALPFLVDFSTTGAWSVDLSNQQYLGYLSMVQTIFVDANDCPNDIVITVNGSNQRVIARANKQGYYSLLCPNPVKLTFTTTPGSPSVPIFLCNSAIPMQVW